MDHRITNGSRFEFATKPKNPRDRSRSRKASVRGYSFSHSDRVEQADRFQGPE